MPMVVVGVLLLVAKMAGFGPFANWSWWIVVSPFIAAVLWWKFADSSGWTQRRVMDKMAERQARRREKTLDDLGLSHRREKLATRSRADAARRTADPTQLDREPGDKGSSTPVPPRRDRRP